MSRCTGWGFRRFLNSVTEWCPVSRARPAVPGQPCPVSRARPAVPDQPCLARRALQAAGKNQTQTGHVAGVDARGRCRRRLGGPGGVCASAPLQAWPRGPAGAEAAARAEDGASEQHRERRRLHSVDALERRAEGRKLCQTDRLALSKETLRKTVTRVSLLIDFRKPELWEN